jgi:hypothetical protein
MRHFTKLDCFTYTQAAAALGVAVWRLRYAVDSDYLPRPGVRFKRRALFSQGQVEWMRVYFARVGQRANAPGVVGLDRPVQSQSAPIVFTEATSGAV